LWGAYDLDVLKPPKRHNAKTYRGPPGARHRRAKRARGGDPRHPGLGHVEIRGLPEPSGSGPDLLPHALFKRFFGANSTFLGRFNCHFPMS
jgi:hypothetical protein